jgi:hypothetical protein
MEFFIKKNATLPVLKMTVVKDGHLPCALSTCLPACLPACLPCAVIYCLSAIGQKNNPQPFQAGGYL